MFNFTDCDLKGRSKREIRIQIKIDLNIEKDLMKKKKPQRNLPLVQPYSIELIDRQPPVHVHLHRPKF